jgi:nucleotide-binding universal stress UspA family protein
MSGFHTLLVPVDFSPHSSEALQLAIELAETFRAKIHLLHAYELSVNQLRLYGVVFPEPSYEKVRDAAVLRLEEELRKVKEAGLEGEVQVIQSSPAEAIAEAARELPADLIVMGTRGYTGLKHVLLGSVAERTVRIAPCPVITLKAAED